MHLSTFTNIKQHLKASTPQRKMLYWLLALGLPLAVALPGQSVRVFNVGPSLDDISVPETLTKMESRFRPSQLTVRVDAATDHAPLGGIMVFQKRRSLAEPLTVATSERERPTIIENVLGETVVAARDSAGFSAIAKVNVKPGTINELTLTMPYTCLVRLPLPDKKLRYCFAANRIETGKPPAAYYGNDDKGELELHLPPGNYVFMADPYDPEYLIQTRSKQLRSPLTEIKPGITPHIELK